MGFGNVKILLLVVYRTPNTNNSSFMEAISEVVGGFNLGSYANAICCGYFNLNMMNMDESDAVRAFIDYMYSCSLLAIITNPTRITEYSLTLIDQFFYITLLITLLAHYVLIFQITYRLFYYAKKFSIPNQQENERRW